MPKDEEVIFDRYGSSLSKSTMEVNTWLIGAKSQFYAG